jgi:hypothetical protein
MTVRPLNRQEPEIPKASVSLRPWLVRKRLGLALDGVLPARPWMLQMALRLLAVQRQSGGRNDFVPLTCQQWTAAQGWRRWADERSYCITDRLIRRHCGGTGLGGCGLWAHRSKIQIEGDLFPRAEHNEQAVLLQLGS